MRLTTYGLVALFGLAIAGEALAQGDAIQETEEPGSEIEIDVGKDGGVEIGRKKNLDGAPIETEGETGLQPLDDPDAPVNPDPVDAELPGEGPEDLSGPGDDDPLPE